MPTKPTVKPRWAEDDVIDPASGQPNVSEPPSSRKDSGWNRREIPPRQWFNWLHRFYYRWIDWLDGTTIPLTLSGSTTNEQKADGTGHTHEITKATQEQAEGGSDTVGMMTSQRTKQAVDSYGFLTENSLQELEDAGSTSQANARENIGLFSTTQAWTDVTGSRSYDTQYTNSTGYFIFVSVMGSVTDSGGEEKIDVLVDSVKVGVIANANTSFTRGAVTVMVPPGSTYEASVISGSPGLEAWAEFR